MNDYIEDLENWPDGTELPSVFHKGECDLPNSCRLYWEKNEVGGRTYISDEIGGGVVVWDTALTDSATLLAAITEENRLLYAEAYNEQRMKRRSNGKS